MKVLEEKVREITCDGLLWGASKLVTLAYGIQKLQISCVVEDDKVSIDWLQEEIEKNEDYVRYNIRSFIDKILITCGLVDTLGIALLKNHHSESKGCLIWL